MRRGRPRGSGYDDRERMNAVSRSMRSGMSRRAAILSLFGPDQLRRIEMKMRVAAMAENANAKIDTVIRATLRGMGLSDEQIADMRMEPVGYYTVEDLAATAERARELGFSMIYRRVDHMPAAS